MDITEMTPAEYAQARLLAKAQSGYSSHLSPSEIEDGLRSGTLIRGKIRLLQSGGAMRTESQGIVDRGGATDTPDILIVGRAALNRACTGDTVVVRLLTRAEENVESNGSILEQSPEETGGEEDNEAQLVEQVEAGEETSLDDVRKPVRGIVVGVSERKWRPFVATLQLDEAGGSRHLAVPVDSS
ncbi:exosome catalytic subunit dis3, partial [Coemansia sp. RSA 922]